MGKKKNNNNENKQQQETEQNPQEPQQDQPQIEGKFLLGKPKFKKLENGRYKCVQTGHELPSAARDSYALTKHCRTGLIDYALARLKPPMNMFHQDPLCRSKLICKLTGDTVNKTEEHIWKHMNGKRFLHMLEKEEAEAGAGKETSNDMMEENGEQKLEEASNSKEDGSKKKKKKKKDKKKKNKKKKEEEKDVSTIVTEIRDPEEKDSDMEDDFWMPPAGDRWDFDDGKDRWASGSESDEDPENADANEEEPTVEESNETQELSKRTKRMSIEVEPSDTESSKKKKKKVEST